MCSQQEVLKMCLLVLPSLSVHMSAFSTLRTAVHIFFKLTLEGFTKICQHIQMYVKIYRIFMLFLHLYTEYLLQ